MIPAHIAQYCGFAVLPALKEISHSDATVKIEVSFRNHIHDGSDFHKGIQRGSLKKVDQTQYPSAAGPGIVLKYGPSSHPVVEVQSAAEVVGGFNPVESVD